MIILKRMTWNNMLSYGLNNEIDFTKNNLTQLIGNNGNGKSSIAIILEEILYNKNSKGKKKSSILNRYCNDTKYWAKLDFTKLDDEYTVEIKRSSTLSIKLYKNGEDISSHTATNTYKQLEEIVGIDHKTFSQIVYKSNSTSLEFLSSTDTIRKKFLIDLLNLERYIELGEKFKKIQNTISKEASELQGKLDFCLEWLKKHEDWETRQEQNLKEIPIIPESLQNQLEDIIVSIRNADEQNKKIKANNLYIERQNSINIESIQVKPDETRTENLKSIIAVNNSKAKELNLNSKELQNIINLGLQCPTCKQEIKNTDSLQEKILLNNKLVKELELEILEYKKELEIKQKELQTWNHLREQKDEWEKLHSLIDKSLPIDLLDKENLQQDKKKLQDQLSFLETSIRDINSENIKISEYNSKVKVIKSQIAEVKTDISKLTSDLEKINKELSIYALLVKVFSNKGLVAYKIESLVTDLEEKTNDYLFELSSGRFRLYYLLSGNDKLNCVIKDNNNEVEISDLSTGELSIVSVAVLLAIRNLMQSLSHTKINLLFLDETMANLDLLAKEKLIEVLIKEEGLNTIIVSHEYSNPLLNKILVHKKDDISYLEEI